MFMFPSQVISSMSGRALFKSTFEHFNRPYRITSLAFSYRYHHHLNNLLLKSTCSLFQVNSSPFWLDKFTNSHLNLQWQSNSLCNARFLYTSSRTRQNRINIKTKPDDKSKTSGFNSSHRNSPVNNPNKNVNDLNKTTSEVDKQHPSNNKNGTSKTPLEPIDQKVVKEGIFTRFKNTYKQHGKIFIGVHLVTSAMWTGMFYYAVASGVDVVALLDWLGISQSVIEKLKSPSLGYIAATYLLYKLATPLRYTVTIVGTRWVVKYMQSSGKMPETPEENKISSLLKEGGMNMKKRPRFRRKK